MPERNALTVQRVLFVCAQNVCRSPYLATSFALRMSHGERERLESVSRGAEVHTPSPMCEVAAGRLRVAHGWAGSRMDDRSQRLSMGDINGADLILTASAAERAAVALLDPSARTRTFTVREAVWLSGPEMGSTMQKRVDEGGLAAFAHSLHSRRGTLALPKLPARRWFGRSVVVDQDRVLDIEDRHRQSSSAHAALFVELDRYVEVLASRITDSLRSA